MRSIADEAVVLQSRCLSYGDGITFWPLAEVFRQAAGIVPEDGEEDARAKLASRFGEELADATSRIESIMGLSEQQYGKDELFWAVRAVLQELVRRRPLVVVFDDIHWAEPTFLDFIEQHPRRVAGGAAPPRLRGPPRAPRRSAGFRRGAAGGVSRSSSGSSPSRRAAW